jgi:coenzyme F420-0:L-glutamate ligase/coenzyme F420-1:gamma-L-glutamate ligase
MTLAGLAIRPIRGVPEVRAGDDLSQLLQEALQRGGERLAGGDVLVVAQKVVSKAEGRWVDLAAVRPSGRALELADLTGKDPRFVEVVLSESTEVLRAVRNVLITRHRLGYVMANAGIDRSNVGPQARPDVVLLLPLDPDASARRLHDALGARTQTRLGVVVSDSFGRPWRRGVVNVALGVAGMPALRDLRGTADRAGRRMETTEVALADAVAAAAGLAMGEAAEGTPAVLVSGLHWTASDASGQTLLRSIAEDLFR